MDEDRPPVAEVKPVSGPGRPIDECIALARARGSEETLDDEFAEDLEEVIGSRKPLDPSVWD